MSNNFPLSMQEKGTAATSSIEPSIQKKSKKFQKLKKGKTAQTSAKLDKAESVASLKTARSPTVNKKKPAKKPAPKSVPSERMSRITTSATMTTGETANLPKPTTKKMKSNKQILVRDAMKVKPNKIQQPMTILKPSKKRLSVSFADDASPPPMKRTLKKRKA